MSTETGEELNRRYHELCGWRTVEHPNNKCPGCGYYIGLHWIASEGRGHFNHPPLLHVDANLAIAEATKVFPLWKLEKNDGFYCFDAMGYTKFKLYTGDTPNEAILKALITAQEKA